MAELKGFPSIDKTRAKYYSEEAVHTEVPDTSMYT